MPKGSLYCWVSILVSRCPRLSVLGWDGSARLLAGLCAHGRVLFGALIATAVCSLLRCRRSLHIAA